MSDNELKFDENKIKEAYLVDIPTETTSAKEVKNIAKELTRVQQDPEYCQLKPAIKEHGEGDLSEHDESGGLLRNICYALGKFTGSAFNVFKQK